MKTCPKCGATSADDTQSFCLMDGMPLVTDAASDPTLVIGQTRPAIIAAEPKKRRTALWVAVAFVVLISLGVVVSAMMFAAYRMGSGSAAKVVPANRPATTKTPPASQTAAPVSTPLKAAASPSPEAPTDTDSDEPTPITWSTSGSTFKNDVGLSYTFECPPDGTAGTVWGSDVYTSDSSICTAAVHAGKITIEKGGVVKIEFTGGKQTYGATVRNGITTYNYGQFPRSYIFK